MTRHAARLGVALVLAWALAGCSWLIAASTDPGTAASRLQITSPVNHSEAPANGSVPVSIRIAPDVDVTTVRVKLSAVELTGASATLDLTSRFAGQPGPVLTTTLAAADLHPGMQLLVADSTSGGTASVSFSWEPAIDVSAADRCEFLGQDRCLLPIPNDYFTVADPSTDTGRRVHLVREAMPENVGGVHIDPAEYNRNDGWSPGSAPVVHVPGIDLAQTGATPITDIARSLDPGAPVLVIDADTGQRHLNWVETDSHVTDDAERALWIRPAANFEEGHRYIVAMRHLKDSAGATLPASRAFQVYRDSIPTFIPQVEARRAHFNQLFDTLADTGVARGDLYLAWDFTVASERSLTERVLHIRDDALATIGSGVPPFTVTQVQDNVSASVFRRVTGTFQVPLYLTGTGAPGNGFNYAPGAGPDALPVRNGTFNAPFVCNIPRATTPDGVTLTAAARGYIYGHGFPGDLNEVNNSSVVNMANGFNMVVCGTNFIGLANEDILAMAVVLQEMSGFPKVIDRVQQGFVNLQFLARLVKNPAGFATNAAFRVGAQPVLRPNEVYYIGNSLGGTLGGAATAVSTEWTRAVLSVPGMNNSLMLPRSTDYDAFGPIIEGAYPDALERAAGLQLVQAIYDRAENDGYAHHMTDDPLPNTPAHVVLLHEAFGDFQVANVATEVLARTIGAALYTPPLAPGRHTDVDPYYGIPRMTSLPWSGSGYVVWDAGNPAPPTINIGPRSPAYGNDPHGRPSANPSARLQRSEFLKPDGAVVDVCSAAPCLAPF